MYIDFLDASKAFDRLVHKGLFLKLLQKGLPLCFIDLIVCWYTNMYCTVKWGKRFSSPFGHRPPPHMDDLCIRPFIRSFVHPSVRPSVPPHTLQPYSPLTDGRTDGRMDGRTDGQTDGRTDGWTDGRTDGMVLHMCRDERASPPSGLIPHLCPTIFTHLPRWGIGYR